MNDPAIQNLDFLRELIAAVRASAPMDDVERLRMLRAVGIGTAAIPTMAGDEPQLTRAPE